MAKFWVTLPIVGTASIHVEAETEEAAIDAAFEVGVDLQNIDEWEVLHRGCQGNVCLLPTHNACANKVED